MWSCELRFTTYSDDQIRKNVSWLRFVCNKDFTRASSRNENPLSHIGWKSLYNIVFPQDIFHVKIPVHNTSRTASPFQHSYLAEVTWYCLTKVIIQCTKNFKCGIIQSFILNNMQVFTTVSDLEFQCNGNFNISIIKKTSYNLLISSCFFVSATNYRTQDFYLDIFKTVTEVFQTSKRNWIIWFILLRIYVNTLTLKIYSAEPTDECRKQKSSGQLFLKQTVVGRLKPIKYRYIKFTR